MAKAVNPVIRALSAIAISGKTIKIGFHVGLYGCQQFGTFGNLLSQTERRADHPGMADHIPVISRSDPPKPLGPGTAANYSKVGCNYPAAKFGVQSGPQFR